MLKSMTGYGKDLVELSNCTIEVEVKSVNHKYCVIRTKLPLNLQSFEHKIISQIKSKLSRGSIDVYITIDESEMSKPNYTFDASRVNQLIGELEKIKDKFQISNGISFETLALFKDFFLEKSDENYDMDKLWDGISLGLSKACDVFWK